MGNWGYENFENDIAYDYLGLLLSHIVDQIREAVDDYAKEEISADFSGDGNGKIVAHIDIIITLCQHYETLPEVPLLEVQRWKTISIEAFDTDMKSRNSSDSDYAKSRRPIIVATFDRLIDLAKEFEE